MQRREFSLASAQDDLEYERSEDDERVEEVQNRMDYGAAGIVELGAEA